MHRVLFPAALLGALAGVSPALAHGVAGARVFVTTLTIDDPAVADEASIPTISYQRSGANGGPGQSYQTNINVDFSKRITENFGLALAGGGTFISTVNAKNRTGFQNFNVTAKYQAYVNAEHEFLLSVGVIQELGGTGAAAVGAARYGSTTPTVYAGKGLGDLPIGLLRPLAVTGTFGYAVSNRGLKLSSGIDPDTGVPVTVSNSGNENRWVGGLSVQYSLPYLQQQVRDVGLGDFFGRLTPLVEIAWSSPASRPSGLGTQLVFAPGVIYSADSYQLGIEALIPGNKASGSNVGVIAQFHVYLDDLFPTSIGKPIFP